MWARPNLGLVVTRADRADSIWDSPAVQPGSRMPERGIQALPLTGAEPIQRHREAGHPDLRHDDLLTGSLPATGAGCRGPPPAQTIHWPKVIASAWPLSIIPADHRVALPAAGAAGMPTSSTRPRTSSPPWLRCLSRRAHEPGPLAAGDRGPG